MEFLIVQNKNAELNIAELEAACRDCVIEDEKDKANFGNFCILLRSFRAIKEASEAILENDDILKSQNGDFYKKVEIEEDNPEDEPIDLSKTDSPNNKVEDE